MWDSYPIRARHWIYQRNGGSMQQQHHSLWKGVGSQHDFDNLIVVSEGSKIMQSCDDYDGNRPSGEGKNTLCNYYM